MYNFCLIHQPREVSMLAKHICQLLFIPDFISKFLFVACLQEGKIFTVTEWFMESGEAYWTQTLLHKITFCPDRFLLPNTNFKKNYFKLYKHNFSFLALQNSLIGDLTVLLLLTYKEWWGPDQIFWQLLKILIIFYNFCIFLHFYENFGQFWIFYNFDNFYIFDNYELLTI